MSLARDIADLASVTTRLDTVGASSGALSNRNLIINGAMQVAQRGTSASVSDSSNEGYQTLDRFALYFSNSAGGVATVSQDTTVPSGYGFSNSYKVDVTTADTSISSTHMIYINHLIEAQNIRNSGWDYTNSSSYITMSFWARSVKAGTYNVVFRATDVGAKYYPVEYTLEADTWKKITVTVSGDSSLVFNNDNGAGLDIRWNLQVGTDRDNGTANQWNATNTENAGTSNQVNFFDSTSNDFYLTGVQLEVGDTATDFEHRTFDDELEKCRRYFFKYSTNGDAMGAGIWYANNQVLGYHKFPKRMRAAPTMSNSGAGCISCYTSGSSILQGGGAVHDNIFLDSCRWNFTTASNGTAGDGTMMQLPSGTFIQADAEL